MIRIAAVALAALSLAACASEGPSRDRGRPPADRSAAGPRVFISPAGEPFRGPGSVRAWFDGADADRDGALSREEFRADHERFFKRVDGDGDGVIAGPEVTRYEQEIAPEILLAIDRGLGGDGGQRLGGPGGRRGGPPGGGRRGGRPRLNAEGEAASGGGRARGTGGGPGDPGILSLLNEPEPVRAADVDLDFRVTLAEWRAMADRRFDRLDADHDGRLLFAELKPEGPQRTERGQGGRRLAPRGGGR